MKKIYSSPTLEVVKIEEEVQLLGNSLEISTDSGSGNGEEASTTEQGINQSGLPGETGTMDAKGNNLWGFSDEW